MNFDLDPAASLDAELDRLLDWANQIGVNFLIERDFWTSANTIFISDFGRTMEDPSTKGHGKIALNALLRLADARQAIVETSYVSDLPALGVYYQSFGFKVDGDPEHITNLKRMPLPGPGELPIPTVTFSQLFHIGSVDPRCPAANGGDSYALPITLHPRTWAEAKGVYGQPVWILDRPSNRFLSAIEISRKLKHAIMDWGIRQGLALQTNNGHASSPLLQQLAHQDVITVGSDEVLQLLLPLYAGEVLDLDGVWWNDRYAPEHKIMPHGVIIHSRISQWNCRDITKTTIDIAA